MLTRHDGGEVEPERDRGREEVTCVQLDGLLVPVVSERVPIATKEKEKKPVRKGRKRL